MADRIDDLTERVQSIDGKVDTLTGTVSELSGRIEQRFDAVDAALVELRQYTEFAYTRLDAKMDAGFTRLETNMDTGFARIERKLDQFIDTQSRANEIVDRRLRALEPPAPDLSA